MVNNLGPVDLFDCLTFMDIGPILKQEILSQVALRLSILVRDYLRIFKQRMLPYVACPASIFVKQYLRVAE